MLIRADLETIATNMWWSWNPRAQGLFARVAPDVWEKSHHSPAAVLRRVTDERLDDFFADEFEAAELQAVLQKMKELESEDTWCARTTPGAANGLVAYFCAEFGLHESLPIYSGGLGVLAGDHIKTTSDLGIPFVGITLKYSEGYFRQRVDHSGWQQESFPATEWRDTALRPVEKDGVPLRLTLSLADRKVTCEVYQVAVGRSTLYLLDTDLPDNSEVDRAICRRLYGGDQSTRIRQEVVLGVGGVRLLRALDLEPTVYHLNEGHSAFACIEMIRERVGAGHSFADALHWVRERTLFTTHTPVPAGHDRFDPGAVSEALMYYQHRMGIPWHDVLGLGRVDPNNRHESFCMTVLALKCAAQANGVSKLHGEVSRKMWFDLTPGGRVDDVPIGHITNGVHAESFMHPIMRELVEDVLGPDWAEHLTYPQEWATRANAVTDEQLIEVRSKLKQSLFAFMKERLGRFAKEHDSCARRGLEVLEGWRDDVLTIGFARRFATYKRGDLILRDFERARRLFADPDTPIQLVVAGKAHPRDNPGKSVIQTVVSAVQNEAFAGRIIFIEDYDLSVGRAMTSGVDVWLNNPRRPREASGTSGEKVPLQAGINLSILDGWWAEGFDGNNGFAIGDQEEPRDIAEQDARDQEALYRALEEEVLPTYYAAPGAGRGEKWRSIARQSFVTLAAEYSTRRMLRDYAKHYYEPITTNQR